jgi:hypothetical protein
MADRPADPTAAISGADHLDAIDHAARAGLRVAPAGVVIVVPAPLGDAADFAPLAAALSSRFEHERRVRVVDLGRDPRLRAAALRLDGFNFAAAGHSLTAELVSPAVTELIRAQKASR